MSTSPDRPAADLPLIIFDGECGFCRASVDRWRTATGPRIRYAPYQEVGDRFPQINPQAFGQAVHFVDAEGYISRGAEAVFRAAAYCGRKRWLLWLYTHVPPLALVAETLYGLIAANRTPLSTLRRVWYGKDLKPPTYHIASALFLRLLGVVYLSAFVSLWTQIDGLVGDRGILPVKDFLDAAQQMFSQGKASTSAVWNLPTLAWINPHDTFLNILCGGGALLSVLLIAGILPLLVLIVLWLDYLSLFYAGQVFLGFQWDNRIIILLVQTTYCYQIGSQIWSG